jgi:hypothetical protein
MGEWSFEYQQDVYGELEGSSCFESEVPHVLEPSKDCYQIPKVCGETSNAPKNKDDT